MATTILAIAIAIAISAVAISAIEMSTSMCDHDHQQLSSASSVLLRGDAGADWWRSSSRLLEEPRQPALADLEKGKFERS